MAAEVIPGRDYVPARGQRIVMPGNQPDWPEDGKPVDPIDAYQLRMVRDGDLVLKPEAEPAATSSKKGN
jgi:hypothetical protein